MLLVTNTLKTILILRLSMHNAKYTSRSAAQHVIKTWFRSDLLDFYFNVINDFVTMVEWAYFSCLYGLHNFDLLPSWKCSVYLSHVLPICIGNIKKEQWCSSQNNRKLTIRFQSERLLLLKGSRCALQLCFIHWRRNYSFYPNLCCTNKLKVVLGSFNYYYLHCSYINLKPSNTTLPCPMSKHRN